jgi:thiamine biosynthesis protein ThiS
MRALLIAEKGRIVECNGVLIAPDKWKSHPVLPNDKIEIIQFMGGG